jgi:hypothetical protein
MLKTFLNNPLSSRSTLVRALLTLKPLFRQLLMSGYIFAFKLPLAFVRVLGTGGNYSFLKAVHESAGTVGTEFTVRDAAESMASTLGPGPVEYTTKTERGEEYPECVQQRAADNFVDITSYYRDGTAISPWHKSVDTVASLYGLGGGHIQRTSSGTGIFDDGPEGALRANATVLWGQQDMALNEHMVLEGIADYLVHGSQVIVLPKSGHFTPMETGGVAALEKAVEWAIKGEKGDVLSAIKSVYPGAAMTVRK